MSDTLVYFDSIEKTHLEPCKCGSAHISTSIRSDYGSTDSYWVVECWICRRELIVDENGQKFRTPESVEAFWNSKSKD